MNLGLKILLAEQLERNAADAMRRKAEKCNKMRRELAREIAELADLERRYEAEKRTRIALQQEAVTTYTRTGSPAYG